ncbi:MAG TPA: CPBP family intramembrane glutamic endopeptidase, partial [Candidatus Limnocylindrales bacterium]
LAVFAVTVIATVAILAPLSAVGLDAGSPAATTIQLLVTMLAYIGIIRLLVVGPGALTWAQMHVTRPNPDAIRDLLVGGLLALPVLVVALVLGAVVSRFVERGPGPLPDATNVTGLVFNLISAAIIAPIGEELFFRGFATTAWARTEPAGRAIVRGAVFFALAHVVAVSDSTFEAGAQRALASFIVLMPVGIALGWVFLSRRSIYASIGLHATYNAIQVVVLVAATGLS